MKTMKNTMPLKSAQERINFMKIIDNKNTTNQQNLNSQRNIGKQIIVIELTGTIKKIQKLVNSSQ